MHACVFDVITVNNLCFLFSIAASYEYTRPTEGDRVIVHSFTCFCLDLSHNRKHNKSAVCISVAVTKH